MSMFEKVLLRAKGFSKEEINSNEKMKAEIKALEAEVKRLESFKLDSFSAREKLRQARDVYRISTAPKPSIWS